MGKAKILVVEDEALVALNIKQCLENMGYEVPATVTSGEAALKKAGELNPDMILMDIQLKGGMDGVSTAQRIKESYDIPIIYLTAFSDDRTLERAKITEPFGYILKPFEEKNLQATLEIALYNSETQNKMQRAKDSISVLLDYIKEGVINTDLSGIEDRGLLKQENPGDLGNKLLEVEQYIDERTEELLQANARLRIEIAERKKAEERLKRLSITDHLTKIYNRMKFNQSLEDELKSVRRYETDLSLIMFDIDHFKDVNDHFGHDRGDEFLIRIAHAVKKRVRKTDIFARWGGEEFTVLLPHTSLQKAYILAERLRVEIEEISGRDLPRVTASFGVVQFQENETEEDIIKRVDQALYLAKNNGRNQVVIG